MADGAAVSLGGNRMAVAEPEFAFRLRVDLRPRAEPFGVAEVMAAVATLHPALEIPDSRYVDFVRAGEAQLIADNACAHQFVLGPAASDGWREVELAAHEVRARVKGRDRSYDRSGSGRAVLGDPRTALVWIANELPRRGQWLRAGQVVTTGACMTPLEVLPGDLVLADYGELGEVSVRFTP
jgi:2-keto-4-pentenoate hydratase